ncbi:MAG TPA: glutaredoxin family protein [Myxococcota bacterium]|nr:glutaredoxin family protein [Myxococcota bacterium]
MQAGTWRRAALLALACASLAAAAQTNVYRWVDQDGKVHFSDAPPPKDARGATSRLMGGGQPGEGQVPYATQVAARLHPVTLYTSTDCGELCGQARALLAQRGVPYRERNAQANPADAEALQKVAGGLQVPVLLVGADRLKGFDESSWQAALDGAGYARTRLPGQPGARPQ